jgi:hypothetical protein
MAMDEAVLYMGHFLIGSLVITWFVLTMRGSNLQQRRLMFN